MQAGGLGGSPCARLAPNHPSLQAAVLGGWGGFSWKWGARCSRQHPRGLVVRWLAQYQPRRAP